MEDGSTSRQATQRLSRRSVLKAAGAGTLVTGLSGCLSGLGGAGGSGTIKIGSTLPMSGPWATVGQGAKRAITLALQHAREDGDMGDLEVEHVGYKDDQLSPQEATKNVRDLIENDDITFMQGAFGTTTVLPSGKICQQNDVLAHGVAGGLDSTGKDCMPLLFNSGQTIHQQSRAGTQYGLEQTNGKKVYLVGDETGWSVSKNEFEVNEVFPEHNAEVIDNVTVPYGETDFSSHITKAKNEGADLIAFNLFAGSVTPAIKQCDEFGVFDTGTVVTAGVTDQSVEVATADIFANNRDQLFSAKEWIPTLPNDAAESFIEAYQNEFDKFPQMFDANYYATTRTILKAYGTVGELDNEAVRKELEGKRITPHLWGGNETFRACDHRARLPPITARGLPSSKADPNSGKILEAVKVWSDIDQYMLDCSETGCDLPS